MMTKMNGFGGRMNTTSSLLMVFVAFGSVFGQDTPAVSPVRPPNFVFLPCSNCETGQIITNPAGTVPAGTVPAGTVPAGTVPAGTELFLTEDIRRFRLSGGSIAGIVVGALVGVLVIGLMVQNASSTPPPKAATTSRSAPVDSATTAGLPDRTDKTVIIAPGPLGIDITSRTAMGAVVTSIKEDSPLAGKVAINDRIISINGVDITTMDHNEIEDLISSTSSVQRKLIVSTKRLPKMAEVTKIVNAPGGKLGITYSVAYKDGARVRKIEENSALMGVLKVGDKIIGINKTDIREMNQDEIHDVVMGTAGGPRKLKIITLEAPAESVKKTVVVPAGTLGISFTKAPQGAKIRKVNNECVIS